MYKILYSFGDLHLNPLYLTMVIIALLLLAMAQSYASAKKLRIGPAILISLGVLVIGLLITYFVFNSFWADYNRSDYVFQNVSIYSYGFMLMLAFVIGTIFLIVQGKKENPPIEIDTILDLIVFIIIGSILGARIVYVLTQPGDYAGHAQDALRITEGGLSIHGGIIGALVFGWFYCWIKGLNYWKMVDFTIVAVPLGMVLGRIGCFLNGCCFGNACGADLWWGTTYPTAETWADRGLSQNLATLYDAGLAAKVFPRHPAPLYEAIGAALIFWYLLNFRKNKLFTGHVFLMFVLLYSILRFIVEFYRFGDPDEGIGSSIVLFHFITMAQLASLVLAFIAIIIMQDLKRRTVLARMLDKGRGAKAETAVASTPVEKEAEEEYEDVEKQSSDTHEDEEGKQDEDVI
ncbi:MAG: prolipoprotein diacylglyceryl transferase [bacterium]|nr:prolipoprotein diacylglyceryl transferase [bacterium]